MFTAILVYSLAHFGAISWAPATVNVVAGAGVVAEGVGHTVAKDINNLRIENDLDD